MSEPPSASRRYLESTSRSAPVQRTLLYRSPNARCAKAPSDQSTGPSNIRESSSSLRITYRNFTRHPRHHKMCGDCCFLDFLSRRLC